MNLAILVSAAALAATAPLPAPWVACSDAAHLAYRAVPPRLNLHNAFPGPIAVRLAAGRTCAGLK